MYKILISRTVEFKAPFQLVAESVMDWTHFLHLHRKSIAGLNLLSKQGDRTVFLYKARRLFPLPFYDHYIVFRQDLPFQHGFRNVYINAVTGASHTLDVKTVQQGDRTVGVGDHLFSLPAYWRWLPKFFPQFFLKIYQWRMDAILDEDLEWIHEEMIKDSSSVSGVCTPAVPANYDVLDDFFKKNLSEKIDAFFQYRIVENFDGKGRLRIKSNKQSCAESDKPVLQEVK